MRFHDKILEQDLENGDMSASECGLLPKIAGAATKRSYMEYMPSKSAVIGNNKCGEYHETATVLLRFYDLCEVLNVDDDSCSSEQETRLLFADKYLRRLRSIGALTAHTRQRSRDIQRLAAQNARADWDDDDERAREPVLESVVRTVDTEHARKTRRVDGHTYDMSTGATGATRAVIVGYDSTRFSGTTHVVRAPALTTDGDFYADIDPSVIRRRQLIQ